MPSRPREKMPIEERAKQFMPFAALRGLPEALAKKEREIEEREEYGNAYPVKGRAGREDQSDFER